MDRITLIFSPLLTLTLLLGAWGFFPIQEKGMLSAPAGLAVEESRIKRAKEALIRLILLRMELETTMRDRNNKEEQIEPRRKKLETEIEFFNARKFIIPSSNNGRVSLSPFSGVELAMQGLAPNRRPYRIEVRQITELGFRIYFVNEREKDVRSYSYVYDPQQSKFFTSREIETETVEGAVENEFAQKQLCEVIRLNADWLRLRDSTVNAPRRKDGGLEAELSGEISRRIKEFNRRRVTMDYPESGAFVLRPVEKNEIRFYGGQGAQAYRWEIRMIPQIGLRVFLSDTKKQEVISCSVDSYRGYDAETTKRGLTFTADFRARVKSIEEAIQYERLGRLIQIQADLEKLRNTPEKSTLKTRKTLENDFQEILGKFNQGVLIIPSSSSGVIFCTPVYRNLIRFEHLERNTDYSIKVMRWQKEGIRIVFINTDSGVPLLYSTSSYRDYDLGRIREGSFRAAKIRRANGIKWPELSEDDRIQVIVAMDRYRRSFDPTERNSQEPPSRSDQLAAVMKGIIEKMPVELNVRLRIFLTDMNTLKSLEEITLLNEKPDLNKKDSDLLKQLAVWAFFTPPEFVRISSTKARYWLGLNLKDISDLLLIPHYQTVERMEILLYGSDRKVFRRFRVNTEKGFNAMLEELGGHGGRFEMIANNERGFGEGDGYRLVHILPITSQEPERGLEWDL